MIRAAGWGDAATWALFLACCVAITRYFLVHDRSLIVRRMHAGPAAEREPRQKPAIGVRRAHPT
jgi:hypothetical protein